NRDAARKEAWEEDERALAAPARFAEEINAKLKGHPGQLGPAVSPGLRMVVDRDSVADGEVAADPPAEPSAPSLALRLYRAGDRWMLNLRQRLEAGDIREDYVHRAERTIRYLKKLVEDLPIDDVAKAELDRIRLAFQSK